MESRTNTISLNLFEHLLVVTLCGEWDWSCARQLCAFLEGLTLEKEVMLDLREATAFDSSTLLALAQFRRRAESHGKVVNLGRTEADCAARIGRAGAPIASVRYWVAGG